MVMHPEIWPELMARIASWRKEIISCDGDGDAPGDLARIDGTDCILEEGNYQIVIGGNGITEMGQFELELLCTATPPDTPSGPVECGLPGNTYYGNTANDGQFFP